MKNLLKRITAVMLVAVLCVCCFAACGGEDAETKATKAPTQNPQHQLNLQSQLNLQRNPQNNLLMSLL